MSFFQIGSFFFGLFMLYVVNIHRKKAALSVLEVSFWYTTWAVFILLALFPNLLLGISVSLSFSRVFDLLVVMAFMVLSVVLITSYFKQRELQQKLERFTRERAIKDAKDNKK